MYVILSREFFIAIYFFVFVFGLGACTSRWQKKAPSGSKQKISLSCSNGFVGNDSMGYVSGGGEAYEPTILMERPQIPVPKGMVLIRGRVQYGGGRSYTTRRWRS